MLLLTRRYSIKEIGGQLGYVNLSNFPIAFKELDELPGKSQNQLKIVFLRGHKTIVLTKWLYTEKVTLKSEIAPL